jgi:hypothetical protein
MKLVLVKHIPPAQRVFCVAAPECLNTVHVSFRLQGVRPKLQCGMGQLMWTGLAHCTCCLWACVKEERKCGVEAVMTERICYLDGRNNKYIQNFVGRDVLEHGHLEY